MKKLSYQKKRKEVLVNVLCVCDEFITKYGQLFTGTVDDYTFEARLSIYDFSIYIDKKGNYYLMFNQPSSVELYMIDRIDHVKNKTIVTITYTDWWRDFYDYKNEWKGIHSRNGQYLDGSATLAHKYGLKYIDTWREGLPKIF